MFSKLLDARRHQQSSEKQLKSDKLKMSDSVRKGTVVWKILMNQVKEDTENMWKTETEKAKTKFQRSKEKQKLNSANDDSIVDGVAVSDVRVENYRENENHKSSKKVNVVDESEALVEKCNENENNARITISQIKKRESLYVTN